MIDEYKQFLTPKDNYWKLAKQLQFNTIEALTASLGSLSSFTTRNSIGLRILGLVENQGSDELTLTSAGRQLLNKENKQDVIDEQLFKIYLDNFVNTKLHIPIFPTLILLELLTRLSYVTFEEYKLFICWISGRLETEQIVGFIQVHRSMSPEEKTSVIQTCESKIMQLGVSDFNDSIYRLFKLYSLSSFIDTSGDRYENILSKNSQDEIYTAIVEQVYKHDHNTSKQFLQTFHNFISQRPDYSGIIEPLGALSNDERKVLVKSIKERNQLPAITDLNIQKIELNLQTQLKAKTKSKINRQFPKKVNYIARDSRNRLLGLHAEKIVLAYEYDKLQKAGKIDIIPKIEHVSISDDTLGYDILSYTTQNQPLHIEVKAVRNNPETVSFYMSKNELDKIYSDRYFKLYLVLDYQTKKPKIWDAPTNFSNLNSAVKVDPVNYLITFQIAPN